MYIISSNKYLIDKGQYLTKIIALVSIVLLWITYQNRSSQRVKETFIYNEPTISQTIEKIYVNPSQIYQCDGRQYCSQMSSCEEATYFLKHCPHPKMDGDGNGIPCEKQWCY